MIKKMYYPNYDESLTSVITSIMQYFKLNPKHKRLKEIDELLSDYQPLNVVLLVLDGLGYNLMNRHLKADDFLPKHTIRSISSLAPATTTSVINTLLSGLNPVEHGWLGWDVYVKPIDEIVTLFRNYKKDDKSITWDYNVGKRYFPYKSIDEQINDNGEFSSKVYNPFGSYGYKGLDDLKAKLILETQKPGKKYLYCYHESPDNIMHQYGSNSEETIESIEYINQKVQEIAESLDNTLLIVVADHGHLDVKNVVIEDYPDFSATLASDISIEGRLCSFRIKDNKEDKFVELFNKYFSEDFILKSKEEVKAMKLFGEGVENKLFDAALGDYLALAKGNKYFRINQNSYLYKSAHAGFTSDEMFVPLIVKYCIKD